MKARGYGLKGRSHFALFRFTARDGLLSGAAVFLLALVLLGTALKETAFSFYPRITALSASPIAILAYLAFGLLVFLPFLLEIVENMRWKALLSSVPKHGAVCPLSDATPGKVTKNELVRN